MLESLRQSLLFMDGQYKAPCNMIPSDAADRMHQDILLKIHGT